MGDSTPTQENATRAPLYKLSEVQAGVSVTIKQLSASPELSTRLREMGFCEEQRVRLLSNNPNLICQVCNARLAISEQLARVILVEAVLEDEVLFEAPFEITAGGPVGDVTFSNVETAFIEGEDDVFVVDAIAEHAVDHVALKFWEAGDAAGAAGLALGGGGQAGRVDGRWRTVDG